MEKLTLSYGETTLGNKMYFATMLFNDGLWSITLPVDSPLDAHKNAQVYRKEGYQTIVVKVDGIEKVLDIRDILQARYPNGKTVLKTISYTDDSIAHARLESNKPIHLRLTNY